MASRPVTHAELVEALATQKLEFRDELHEALRTTKDDILEAVQEYVRDAQTEILKAFLPYQEGQNIRLRTLENVGTGISERIAVVERRLAEIEKKLLLHPPNG
jgi:predicted RNA-binding protein